jgi:hypothetical protein
MARGPTSSGCPRPSWTWRGPSGRGLSCDWLADLNDCERHGHAICGGKGNEKCVGAKPTHGTTGPDNTNNVLALAFGLLIVLLVVGGSMVIMADLNAMMPSSDMMNLHMQH